MTGDELRAFLDRRTDAWNRHDVQALAATHSETGTILSPMFGHVEGRLQIERTYAALFTIFPDWEITLDRPIIEGTRGAQSFTVTATQQGEFIGIAPSGKRCIFEGVSLVVLDEQGLIAEERRIYDFTGLLAQIGVFRLKPA